LASAGAHRAGVAAGLLSVLMVTSMI
jgi:hypothetical protein